MKPTKPFWSSNAVWAISIIGIIAFVIVLHSLFNGNFPPRNIDPLKKADTSTPLISPSTLVYDNVQGKWMAARGADYCNIAQQKNDLLIEYFYDGKTSLKGSGKIYGRELLFTVNDPAIGKIEFELVVSKGDRKMIGRMTIFNNSQSASKAVTFTKAN